MIFMSHAQAQNCLVMCFIINSLEFPYLLTQYHKVPWNILNHSKPEQSKVDVWINQIQYF